MRQTLTLYFFVSSWLGGLACSYLLLLTADVVPRLAAPPQHPTHRRERSERVFHTMVTDSTRDENASPPELPLFVAPSTTNKRGRTYAGREKPREAKSRRRRSSSASASASKKNSSRSKNSKQDRGNGNKSKARGSKSSTTTRTTRTGARTTVGRGGGSKEVQGVSKPVEAPRCAL